MSHSYGERPPSLAKGFRVPAWPDTTPTRSKDRAENVPTTSLESDLHMEKSIIVIMDDEKSNGRFDIVLAIPSSDDLGSWTLAQMRASLEKTVIEKMKADGQAREQLENRRLELIERIIRIERAEQKEKDAARRVIIGRDVEPPPPDPIDQSWRKKKLAPNSRRSGPTDPQKKRKRDNKDTEQEPEEELYSKRWRLRVRLTFGNFEGEVLRLMLA